MMQMPGVTMQKDVRDIARIANDIFPDVTGDDGIQPVRDMFRVIKNTTPVSLSALKNYLKSIQKRCTLILLLQLVLVVSNHAMMF